MATVHIVGAGIAGLTLAAALRRPEWDVHLHEQVRPEDAPDVDTAFGLWPPAMAALDAIGLGDAVRAESAPLAGVTVRTAQGRVLTRMTGQVVAMIGRSTLQRSLAAAVPAHVTLATERIEDPRALSGDLLVGADGAFSVVRREHWGKSSGTRPRRVTVVRGVVDADLGARALDEYWGDGVLFGRTPLPGARTNWFCVFDERRFASTADGLEHTRDRLRTFPREVGEVIEAATPEQTLIGGIDVSRPMRSFVRGRTVLIGDAAHAMTPNLGRGACEAVRDAVVLGTLLSTHDVPDALDRYRAARLVGPQMIRALSSATSHMALAHGGAARWRDCLLARAYT